MKPSKATSETELKKNISRIISKQDDIDFIEDTTIQNNLVSQQI